MQVLKESLSEAEQEGGRLLVRLMPAAELLHEKDFVAEVADLCRPERCAVELAGSTLSHVYYELTRAGVQVLVVDPMEATDAQPVTFGKLVRDRIPSNIEAQGERVRTYTATGHELDLLLRRKVLEEAFEVASAESPDNLTEELGDLLDVVTALCRILGTNVKALIAATEDKRRARGAFDQGMVLVETHEPSLREALRDDGGTYDVSPDVAAAFRQDETAVIGELTDFHDELTIPYVVDNDAGVRVSIMGEVYDVCLLADGIHVTRRGPEDDPDQLVLAL